MKKIISYEHVKRIACFLCPIICVFLYWSGTNNEIDIEKKELYNKNLDLFKVKILEHFKDEKLLEKLLCNNAKHLFKI